MFFIFMFVLMRVLLKMRICEFVKRKINGHVRYSHLCYYEHSHINTFQLLVSK